MIDNYDGAISPLKAIRRVAMAAGNRSERIYHNKYKRGRSIKWYPGTANEEELLEAELKDLMEQYGIPRATKPYASGYTYAYEAGNGRYYAPGSVRLFISNDHLAVFDRTDIPTRKPLPQAA